MLTGRYTLGDCTGPEKARRVRERYELARYPTIFAYGDTAEDEDLLSLATRRFLRGRELEGAPSALGRRWRAKSHTYALGGGAAGRNYSPADRRSRPGIP